MPKNILLKQAQRVFSLLARVVSQQKRAVVALARDEYVVGLATSYVSVEPTYKTNDDFTSFEMLFEE